MNPSKMWGTFFILFLFEIFQAELSIFVVSTTIHSSILVTSERMISATGYMPEIDLGSVFYFIWEISFWNNFGNKLCYFIIMLMNLVFTQSTLTFLTLSKRKNLASFGQNQIVKISGCYFLNFLGYWSKN